MDRRGAEIGQHYELFNERVIADAAIGSAAAQCCDDTSGREALAAACVRRDHESVMTGGAA